MSELSDERVSVERFWGVLIGMLVLLLCCLTLLFCSTLAGVGYLLTREQRQAVPTVEVILVTATPTPMSLQQGPPGQSVPEGMPTPMPQPDTTPLPLKADERGVVTMAELNRVVVPTRDLRVLGMRFNPDLGDLPSIVNPTPPRYQVGDERTFWVNNADEDRHFQVVAELKYITPHAYFWVEKEADVDAEALAEAARTFEDQIYPTNRRVFGQESQPGIDNDPHITFLHAYGLGSRVAGYFSSADAYPSAVSEFSNEKDMFYINLDATTPGDSFYLQVIAHEFQHMIHWYQDRNEDTWLNEGLSVLAEVINGYPLGGQVFRFLNDPDVQLTGWSEDNAGPHYGAAGLFTYYFYQRFGEEMVQALARHPENGMAGVDAVLAEKGVPLTAMDVFADWVVANVVNDPRLEKGIYGYEERVDTTAAWAQDLETFPVSVQDTVAQYGTDYIHLSGADTVRVRFQGQEVNQLAPLSPHSGRYVMWSNRGDDSDSRLYTEVDLSQATEATLIFWTWYDIEELWDFAYVIVSTDGGEHWTMLESPNMTREDPYGNNLGIGYTGISGGGEEPQWIEERIDLTPFLGQKILVGFEYVTDDALTEPGFFVDDVRVEGVGLAEDFEGDLTGWVQEGFIRTDTYVPQSYLVQVIRVNRRKVSIQRHLVEGGQPLELVLNDLKGSDVTLAISAIAPVTWELASYTLELR